MGLAPSGSPSHGRQPPRHGALWRAATLAAIYRANAGGRTPSPPTRSPTYGSRRVPTRRLSLFVAVHGWGAPLGGELLRHGALHDDLNIAPPGRDAFGFPAHVHTAFIDDLGVTGSPT